MQSGGFRGHRRQRTGRKVVRLGKVAAKKAIAKTAARRLSAGLHAAKVDTSAGKVLTVLK